jgi:cardiolipin synthase
VRTVTATNVSLLTVALYLLDLAIKVVALGLVPEGRRPSSASAWLLLILFLPVIGLVAFWLIGSPRGVKVRLMFDHIGTSRIPGYRNMIKKLKHTAIEWHPMLPVQPLKGKWRRPDLRNHRKIVIIDGRVAFVGSLNMIDASYHNRKHERAGRKWRELLMQVSGPVVFSLNIIFATDWYLETDEVLREDVQPYASEMEPGEVLCQVVPSGPGFPDENNLRLFNSLIYSAQRRLSITSPYFVPDDSLLYDITTAAQRGIDVELFVGEPGDQFMVHHAQSSYYKALLKAGVKIYLYPAPFVLHSKHFSVDDDVAVIGSSNMDIRSFNLDFEVSVMCLSRSLTTAMRQVEDHYRSSRELTLVEWARRPLRKRYIDNVMRLMSALQ